MVMPEVAIDTDGAEEFNYALPYADVMRAQARIGVPCIYQAEWLMQRRDFCVPDIRKLTEPDYAVIAEIWKAYRIGRKQA